LKVFDLRDKSLRLVFQFDGATELHTRFQSGNIIVADDCGRVLVVNLERGKIVGEWRI
jgi:signal transduction protein with GAF and PtsI domain